MSPHSIKHAITEGLNLAKKSISIFVIYYLFTVLIYIHLTEFPKQILIAAAYMPLYIGFVFSIPLHLDRQRRNILTGKSVIINTLHTLKRLLIPLGIFALVFIMPFVYLFEKNPVLLRNFALEIQKQQNAITVSDFLMSAFIVSLFSFTSFFFTLNKANIVSSAARSVSAVIKNPLYLIVLSSASFVQILIRNLVVFDTVYGNVLFTIPTAYFVVIIASTNLIYFQNTIQKPPQTAFVSKIPFVNWLLTSSPERNMLIALLLLIGFYFLLYQPAGL